MTEKLDNLYATIVLKKVVKLHLSVWLICSCLDTLLSVTILPYFRFIPMLTKLNDISLRASVAALAFLSAPKAFAQGELFGPVPDIGGVDGTDTDAIRTGILDILDIILSFMALIAVVIIVIAGIQLVISQGEEQAKDKAKKSIFYAIIGLVVILLAQAIVGFVQDVGQNVGTTN